MEVVKIASGAALTALLLAVGHWLPLPRPMPLLARYGCGVVAIIAGFTLWYGLGGSLYAPAALTIVATVGGLVVLFAYTWDEIIKDIRKARKHEATDAEL